MLENVTPAGRPGPIPEAMPITMLIRRALYAGLSTDEKEPLAPADRGAATGRGAFMSRPYLVRTTDQGCRSLVILAPQNNPG